jgi:hypothetical protein
MALGFLTKASPEQDFTHEKKVDPDNADAERQGSAARRMSRIDATDSDSGLSVGAQIEMEKDAAIQYRTCGWKKVRRADHSMSLWGLD